MQKEKMAASSSPCLWADGASEPLNLPRLGVGGPACVVARDNGPRHSNE